MATVKQRKAAARMVANARPKVNFQPEAWIEISKIIPHPKNPRIDLKKNKERFQSLLNSLEYGLFEPIKISKRSGYCLAGHQRLSALKQLGYSEVPVMYNDCLDEKEEIEILIKDNNKWGEYDRLKMTQIMQDLDYALDLGFTDTELKNFGDTALLMSQIPEINIPTDHNIEIIIEFQDEDSAQELFNELTSKGHSCRILKS